MKQLILKAKNNEKIQAIGIYLLFILIMNLILYSVIEIPFSSINELGINGIIIKNPQLNYSTILAHGRYQDFEETDPETNQTYNLTMHTTSLNNESKSTAIILGELKKQGYTKVWLSMCDTGKHEYLYKNFSSNFTIYWSDYPEASRKEKKGDTIPIFTGLGWIRI